MVHVVTIEEKDLYLGMGWGRGAGGGGGGGTIC